MERARPRTRERKPRAARPRVDRRRLEPDHPGSPGATDPTLIRRRRHPAWSSADRRVDPSRFAGFPPASRHSSMLASRPSLRLWQHAVAAGTSRTLIDAARLADAPLCRKAGQAWLIDEASDCFASATSTSGSVPRVQRSCITVARGRLPWPVPACRRSSRCSATSRTGQLRRARHWRRYPSPS